MRVYFVDFWKGFDANDNFFIHRLRGLGLDVCLDSERPEYLFCSSFGHAHLRYTDCVKIYFTGENDVPDFNWYDYAMAFHPLSFGDRYLRFPLYVLYKGFEGLSEKCFDASTALDRKFCNFVYSNARWADPFRDRFFRELSKYKKIDSGGRHLNNIGGPVADKMTFIRDYKFTIAFENSALPGYTTEKLMEPMVVNSLPIYWGNPCVEDDFNERSFIRVRSEVDMKRAIEEIIRLDTDDDAYLVKLSEPWTLPDMRPADWLARLDAFLLSIFKQSPEEARRCTEYGFARLYRQKVRKREKWMRLFYFISKG